MPHLRKRRHERVHLSPVQYVILGLHSSCGEALRPVCPIRSRCSNNEAPYESYLVLTFACRADLVAATSEFVGTFWFLFFGYAAQLMVHDQAATATGLGPSPTIYISLGW
ncbi:hypothetical protein F4678DRAFT_47376 [Xylaria arbuscula]|nr:hypothetical protein F4678DRAFT_47376 [Xylaria arbuscula]